MLKRTGWLVTTIAVTVILLIAGGVIGMVVAGNTDDTAPQGDAPQRVIMEGFGFT